jgi:hypothetical protein
MVIGRRNRTVAIGEAEAMTQRKSKTPDRGRRLYRFALLFTVLVLVITLNSIRD